MNSVSAIEVAQLSHRYGDRLALDQLSLEVQTGERFALLGPNGSGKTTLFRLLSTLIRPQSGTARILGYDVAQQAAEVRACIGVIFQAPSLDRKLTVAENIRYQAALYGLRGTQLRRRQQKLLEQLGLSERSGERVEALSGGLRRRVELAKGLVHEPRLLLMDEPTTGLDPAARSDVWRCVEQLRTQLGVSVIYTTHLLEEAEDADRLAILDQGRLVALDRPADLCAALGGDTITLRTDDAEALAAGIRERFGLTGQVIDGEVRLELADGHEWIPRLVEAFPQTVQSLALGKPSLEDVFIHRTGHHFWRADEEREAR